MDPLGSIPKNAVEERKGSGRGEWRECYESKRRG